MDKQRKPTMTDDKLNFIRENVNKLTNKELAEKFKTTISVITCNLCSIGVTRDKPLREVSQFFFDVDNFAKVNGYRLRDF